MEIGDLNNAKHYNSKLTAMLLTWLENNSISSSGSGTNVTETNSAALLAATLDLALPTEDQNALLRFLKAGVSTTVEDDQPLPVVLSTTSGEINVTAGDINVQLDHTGANFDSTRIGDGANLLHVNTDGSINSVIKEENVLSRYAISRDDTITTTEYYGFVDVLGHWYILKIDTTSGEYTYAKGTTSFLTNWGNRATTVLYAEFNQLTW